MNFKTVFTSPTLQVDLYCKHDSPSDKVAFIFSPLGNRNLAGNDFGGNVLLGFGYDCFSFKSIDDDWFQCVPNSLFDRILEIKNDHGYKKSIGYGSSMGGFAVLAFSKLLGIDLVLALSPQYAIDESFDQRWSKYSSDIDFNYRINNQTISTKTKFFLAYDPEDDDKIHVDKIKSLIPPQNFFEKKLKFYGHPCTMPLFEFGILKDFLINVFEHQDFLDFNERVLRKNSTTYLISFATILFNRGHKDLAIKLLHKYSKEHPNDARFLFHIGLLMQRKPDVYGAINSLKEALKIDPNNDAYQAHLLEFIRLQSP